MLHWIILLLSRSCWSSYSLSFFCTLPLSVHVSDGLWQVPHCGDRSVCVGRGWNTWHISPERLSCVRTQSSTKGSRVFLWCSDFYFNHTAPHVSFELFVSLPLFFFFSLSNSEFLPVVFHMSVSSPGCGSDTEAEQVFRMEASVHQNKGYIPPPLLRRKPGRDENVRVCTGPLTRYCKRGGYCTQKVHVLTHHRNWLVREKLSLCCYYLHNNMCYVTYLLCSQKCLTKYTFKF